MAGTDRRDRGRVAAAGSSAASNSRGRPKTVEANLAKVYRKLGIRSRAELGALLEPHRIG